MKGDKRDGKERKNVTAGDLNRKQAAPEAEHPKAGAQSRWFGIDASA